MLEACDEYEHSPCEILFGCGDRPSVDARKAIVRGLLAEHLLDACMYLDAESRWTRVDPDEAKRRLEDDVEWQELAGPLFLATTPLGRRVFDVAN
jgi:hypothetical protein